MRLAASARTPPPVHDWHASDAGHQRAPQSISYAQSGELRRAELESCNCLVVSDSCHQIDKSSGSVYNIVRAIQQDGVGQESFRFVLFKDEADSMLRTEDKQLLLEQAITKLERTTSTYHGAQLIINISATLMPVFLEMQRTGGQPRGPVFLTRAPGGQYSGVPQFMPLRSSSRELHPEIEEGEEIDDDRVFLVDSFARDADLGVNDQVSAMFEDALRRDGGRKKALLLDITQAKVYVPTGVFDKAEKMQNDFPALHVLVYCGRGIVVRFSRTATQNAALADVKSTVAPGSGRVILPPRWSSSIPRPQSGGRESCAWRTDAKQMWGKAGNGFDDKGTTIGCVL